MNYFVKQKSINKNLTPTTVTTNLIDSTVVLTGGGTAGHVVPALALIPELKKRFADIVFIGGDGMEKGLAERESLTFYSVPSVGLSRGHIFKNFKIPFVLKKGIRLAGEILDKIKPSAVFSKGGFASMPTVIAALKRGVPVIAHESDMTIGLANKIAYHRGAKIITAFKKTADLKSDFTFAGFPLRQKLFNGDASKARKDLGIVSNKPVLLVVGGSSGSAALNSVVYSALPALIKKYEVVHITGKNKQIDYIEPGYHGLQYSHDIQNLYALADIIVSRAGAGAVSEIAALKKSAVLIPLPAGSSRGDQIVNAEYAKEYGAVVLPQSQLDKNTLIDAINSALTKKMRPFSPSANEKIADILASEAEKFLKFSAHKTF